VTDNVLVRLRRGWLALFQREGDGWWLAWTPDGGPSRTYSPGETNLPSDYPGAEDPEQLLAWARHRFGC
jgi:hypothetical protein